MQLIAQRIHRGPEVGDLETHNDVRVCDCGARALRLIQRMKRREIHPSTLIDDGGLQRFREVDEQRHCSRRPREPIDNQHGILRIHKHPREFRNSRGFALRLVLKVHGMEYPRDYKLLNIGGASDRYQALTSGQISSAPVGVPLDLVAKQQGFNILGYFADDQPNFQFNVYIVKRSWAEKNRALVVRFMKAMVSTMRWMMDNREAACGYLSKEMAISTEHCRYASDYNWKSRIWDRNADLNVEGVRTLIKITAEQGILREPLPEPSKYIDQSYLKQALAELAKK